MSTDALPPLHALFAWIRAHDEHAPVRLALLDRLQRFLNAEEAFSDRQRQELAGRLERWRYQHLDRCGGRCTAEDRRLLDMLDEGAARLAGRPVITPPWPRGALVADCCEELARLAACLEPRLALADLCRRAAALTQEHFQRRIRLYAPLYLSNYCINHCVYCGFRHPLAMERTHLDFDAAMAQAGILDKRGFRHILLVAGDFPSLTSTQYFVPIIRALSQRGVRVVVEIAPQTTAAYAELVAAGACGVTLYQETYNQRLYALYHPRGSKASYDWRLEGLERAARAGMRRLGLGHLLGLAAPYDDLTALVRHAVYLKSRLPASLLSFSLPRICQAPQGFETPFPVDDQTFLRMYCALRVAFPQAELVLSTREVPAMRNLLATICITQLSAGSCTAPGGYCEGAARQCSGQQFPVCDDRSTDEVAQWLREAGMTVTWEL
ncbi:MAG: radical SAM protein [Thermoguttaceae bacterium]|jgi:2-iminoacetate synthase